MSEKRKAGPKIRQQLDEILGEMKKCDQILKATNRAKQELRARVLELNDRYDFTQETGSSQFYRSEAGTIQVTRPQRAPILTPARRVPGEDGWDPRHPALLDILREKIEDPDAARELFLRLIVIEGLTLDEKAWEKAVRDGEVEDRWLAGALTFPESTGPTVRITPNKG